MHSFVRMSKHGEEDVALEEDVEEDVEVRGEEEEEVEEEAANAVGFIQTGLEGRLSRVGCKSNSLTGHSVVSCTQKYPLTAWSPASSELIKLSNNPTVQPKFKSKETHNVLLQHPRVSKHLRSAASTIDFICPISDALSWSRFLFSLSATTA